VHEPGGVTDRARARGYVRRTVDDELDVLLTQLPAVLLDGAKGVGKTATALERARSVWRLDDPAQAAIVRADPAAALAAPAPLLLDEWHRVPEVWDAVKRAVDADATPGRILLTGSAPFAHEQTHSGAGRIALVRMRPLTLTERGHPASVSLAALLAGSHDTPVSGTSTLELSGYVDELLRSGLPGLRHLEGRALRTQLNGYVERIVERELREAGVATRRPQAVLGWLRAYAAAVATTVSFERIRAASAPGHAESPSPRSTVQPQIEALTALRVIDEVPALTPGMNHLRRLTLGPKHHLVDPALAAVLLRTTASALLGGSASAAPVTPRRGDATLLGALFESFATLCVRVAAQAAESDVAHLRTRDSTREVDLVVTGADGRLVAIEVKLGARVDDHDVRHLSWLAAELGERVADRIVLTTGAHAYRRSDGVAVVPLALLGP
jgi:predicted AAA+ superfamily ATPase